MSNHPGIHEAWGEWTAERMGRSFDWFRDHGRLRRGTWYDSDSKRACALGAAFLAEESWEASERACITKIMPTWLVNLTPILFDNMSDADAFAWANALYSSEGLIREVAERPDAAAIWVDAEQRLVRSLQDNACLQAELGPSQRKHLRETIEFRASTDGIVLAAFGNDAERNTKLSGMIVDAIADALAVAP